MTKHSEQNFLEDIMPHRGIIIKICKIYKTNPADQDDLYQEIILNAWKSYSRFEGRSKFSTWLYRVALNTALSENRKDKFFGLVSKLDAVQNVLPDSLSSDRSERTSWLYRAIERLDPLEKSIILLFLDEISYQEISEITGITENNIRVRLHRIRNKLKDILISTQQH